VNNELEGIWKETGVEQLEVQFICAECGQPQTPSVRVGFEHETPENKQNFDCSAQ